MKALNLEEMTNFSGGVAEADPGITCFLVSRAYYEGIKVSHWNCSNGSTMTNFSSLNADGDWEPFMTL